ncbi:MAG: hypothetical protein NTV68_14715 [Methanomicrobiales archaeon]|nr:hypothetical protein [Methanomicrobiales archaeon]
MLKFIFQILLHFVEAVLVGRENSRLKKRHARYKRYYDSYPGAMQKKNRDYYWEHRDTIHARSR